MSAVVTRFPILDAQGALVAFHIRRDHPDGSKGFAWEVPDGTSGLSGMPARSLPLYGSEDVSGWSDAEPVFIVEGEKPRDVLTRAGFHALATVTGASACPDAGPLSVVRGFPVILWADADEVGRRHMRKISERIRFKARDVKCFTWDGAPDHGDAADYLSQAVDAATRLREEMSRAPSACPDDLAQTSTGVVSLAASAFGGLPEQPSAADRLAVLTKVFNAASSMSALERTALGQEVAARLRSTGSNAKEAAELTRAALKTVGARETRAVQGTALELRDPDPWPEPVDGAVLAEEIASLLAFYVVLEEAARWAVVLWIIFTYVIDAVDVAPRLLVTSPVKACGKTRLLTLLAALTRRALPASNITPAVVFRVVEAHFPTLLLDEIDNLRLNEKQDLLGILNSGHTRGTACVYRIVGEDLEPRAFSTWCPIAMAGIRTASLPDTATSRAIKVPLSRKRRGEAVALMREGRLYAELESVRARLARWAADHAKAIGEAEPGLPAHLDGRTADNWSVLIAIGDALGGEWSVRSRDASVTLEGETLDEESVSETLLSDLRDIFASLGIDRLTSAQVTSALEKIEGRPWAEWGPLRKPITKHQFARLLKGFGVRPGTIRLADGTTAKGYYRVQFEDAWERYLPRKAADEASHRHIAEVILLNANMRPGEAEHAASDDFRHDAMPVADCDGVTGQPRGPQNSVAIPPGPLREFLDGLPLGVEP